MFSRDELKQYEMQQELQVDQPAACAIFIGDVRDRDGWRWRCATSTIVIHAAAMKHVPAAEYNPIECIQTNVLGAENVVHAAMTRGVEQVIALSTDKAANPVNLYGATKLASDKFFVAANAYAATAAPGSRWCATATSSARAAASSRCSSA